MAESSNFDFTIIGGGSAGYAAARTAASLGLRTAVIDGASELSGLCILRGCMPSKSLIESANRNLVIRHAENFGLKATQGPADTRFIRDRKRSLIKEFADYRAGQLEDGRFELIRGFAKFTGEDENGDIKLEAELRENGGTVSIVSKTVLIASGSVIHIPEIQGLEESGYWTSDTLLDEPEIPESFIVLGGGAIALEMAHYLDGIDRKVTVIQRSKHILKEMDSDVAEVIEKAFDKRGIQMFTDTKIEKIEKTASGKKIYFQHQGENKPVTIEAAEILAALGRKPATSRLELENVKVASTKNGQIKVESSQQTTNPRIFAAGDVCGPLEVVHLAIQQGETAAKNAAALLNDKTHREHMDYRCKLFGVFTVPQAAAVGLSEAECREQNVPYLVATYPFNDHGKSMVMGELDGFVKLIGSPDTGKILGGSVVGPEATELIHEISVAMHLGATAEQIVTAPHYHPTLGEIWTYPAEEIVENLSFHPRESAA